MAARRRAVSEVKVTKSGTETVFYTVEGLGLGDVLEQGFHRRLFRAMPKARLVAVLIHQHIKSHRPITVAVIEPKPRQLVVASGESGPLKEKDEKGQEARAIETVAQLVADIARRQRS